MRRAACAFAALLGLTATTVSAEIVLTPIGTYSTGLLDAGGAGSRAQGPRARPGLVGLTATTVSAEIVLTPIGTYSTGIFDAGGAEIVAYDPVTQRLFVVNADANRLDVLDIRKPGAPARVSSIDLSPFGGGVNSVAVHGGIVAAAVEDADKQAPGNAALFDAARRPPSAVTVR